MQTRKAHARFVHNKGGPLWVVSHPATPKAFWSTKPHDAAITLLKEFVIPRQCEARGALKAIS